MEPEEVAFMMDVHMLLGKELDASYNTKKPDGALTIEEEIKDSFDEDEETSANIITSTMTSSSSSSFANQNNDLCSYTLQTMTPESVHTGMKWSILDEFH